MIDNSLYRFEIESYNNETNMWELWLKCRNVKALPARGHFCLDEVVFGSGYRIVRIDDITGVKTIDSQYDIGKIAFDEPIKWESIPYWTEGYNRPATVCEVE